VRSISPEAVRQLYDLAGWWPHRNIKDIAYVLGHDCAVGVWDNEHLIGFARAVSDGRFRAYIEDVVVHPDYRHRGTSRLLMAELLKALGHIETISLFCEPGLVPLYERHGFQLHPVQRVLHRKGST
jgi:GNAT superfamily N-acetyltransferase